MLRVSRSKTSTEPKVEHYLLIAKRHLVNLYTRYANSMLHCAHTNCLILRWHDGGGEGRTVGRLVPSEIKVIRIGGI